MSFENTTEQYVELEGTVIFDAKGCFKVEFESGQVINAKPSGKMRQNKIQIITGDKVIVQCSIYDLTNGRIVRRVSSGKVKFKELPKDEEVAKKNFNKKQKDWK